MGIILPVNKNCRIESDSTQWIVSRRSGDNWNAVTFWQNLDAALRDCILLNLATPAEADAMQPLLDRLANALSRVAELAEQLPPDMGKGVSVDLGAGWNLHCNDREVAGRRPHWIVTRKLAKLMALKKRLIMGTYRSPSYALQQCALLRLRESDGFESLEKIIHEISEGLKKPPMALLEAVTGV